LLTGDPELAKQEIQKRIKKLVLTPKQTADGTVLEVTGDVELFKQQEDVMLNNSMEGIAQHYTTARIALAHVVLRPSMALAL
jgi:DNA/RNA endonuclease YhcR with UshA esterase domain